MLVRFFKYYFVGFFLIFGPVLNGTSLGSYGDVIFILSFLIIVLNISKGQKPKYFSKDIFFFTTIMILLVIYPMFTTLIFDSQHFKNNIQVYVKPVRIFITYLGCYFFVLSIYKDQAIKSEYKLMYIFNIIYYSVVVHAMIMCIQFFNPAFRDFIYQFTVNLDDIRSEFSFKFRMGGLVGTGSSPLSIFQAIGFLLFPFVQSKTKKKLLRFLNLAFQVLIFLSIIISGRSGIFAIFLFLPLIEMLRGKNVLAVSLKYILLYGSLFIVGYGLLIILLDFIGDAPLGGPLFRSFDVLIESREAGKYENGTQEALTQMLLFPRDFATIFFGKPFYFLDAGSTERLIVSDIGYIVYLWGFGIIGFVMYHIFYIHLIVKTTVNIKINNYFLACFIVTLIILVFQAKELFIFARVGFSIHMLLYFSALFQSKYSLNKS